MWYIDLNEAVTWTLLFQKHPLDRREIIRDYRQEHLQQGYVGLNTGKQWYFTSSNKYYQGHMVFWQTLPSNSQVCSSSEWTEETVAYPKILLLAPLVKLPPEVKEISGSKT